MSTTAKRRPNVLFITADQWRGDALGYAGHPCVRTPHIDRLAAEGTFFSRHYSQAAPCGPGRASLYTGLYLHQHRVVANGTPLARRHTNFALEARKLGYEPVLFGHTDIGPDPAVRAPGDPDLASYEGLLPGIVPMVWLREDLAPWIAELRSKGHPFTAENVFAQRKIAGPPRGQTYAPAGYDTDNSISAYLTDELLKFLAVPPERPWFAHLSLWSPHPPFVVSEPYHDMYDPKEVPAPVRASSPESEARQHPYLAYFLSRPWGSGVNMELDAAASRMCLNSEELRQVRATYFGMVSEVDAQVGRIIGALEASGEYEQTLILMTSDHGEQLGDHWQFGKFGYFDQSFHIPLVVRCPGPEVGRGRVVSAFTENVDVLPTMLDVLGGEIPTQCEGRSLRPWIVGEDPSGWRREAHYSFDFRDRLLHDPQAFAGLEPDQCCFTALRDERYKYVHFAGLNPLFFDLEQDPDELENRAEDPAYGPLVLEYAQRMLSWRMAHDDQTLANIILRPDGPTPVARPHTPHGL